ncbi:hypothetical protein [Planctomycetes bacterium CA13]
MIRWLVTTAKISGLCISGLLVLGPMAFCVAQSELGLGDAITKSGKIMAYSSMPLDDLGPIRVAYDTTGLRSISPAPAPGIHPRMLKSPDDRPEMVRIYRTTPQGQRMYAMMIGWCDILKGKIHSLDQCPKNELDQPLAAYQRSHFGELADQYQRILAGDLAGYEPSLNDYVMGCMALEAYRCWIEDDAASGKELARAMVNIAKSASDGIKPGDHVGEIGAYNMGFCYDFNYNFMADDQRDVVRSVIAKISAHQSHYGAFLPSEATTSNWCALDSFLPLTLLAIEGEEGFNRDYYDGWKRAYYNFLTYGWYASGAGYEGLGKNYQFVTTLIALAKRSEPLVGHPHVRAYGERFLPSMSLPNQQGFVAYDDWGGTGADTVVGDYRFNINDVVGLKWLYPQSKPIDYVWRAYFGKNYERYTDLRPAGYFSSAMIAVLFPSVPLGDGEPSADAAGLQRSFFAPQRGLMVTRSDFTSDALYLQMHTRQDLGGHTHADRTSFMLAGLGRLWSPILSMSGGSRFGNIVETRFHSNILIDDMGQGASGGWAPQPARVMDYVDNGGGTFCVGDAKYAYDWIWMRDGADDESSMLGQGWQKVSETPNDFQYRPVDLPWMNQSWYDRAHWLRPGESQRCVKKPFNPVQRAFRTAGIVRGKHPYALVIDDIQKDDQVHNFKWLMQLSDDLEIIGRYQFSEDSPITAMVLGAPDDDRQLWVCILQSDRDDTLHRYSDIGRVEQYMGNVRWGGASKRLVIESWAKSPEYKVLLWPFRNRERLPEANWNAEKETVTIQWADQVDTITFASSEANRTTFTVMRDEQEVVKVD